MCPRLYCSSFFFFCCSAGHRSTAPTSMTSAMNRSSLYRLPNRKTKNIHRPERSLDTSRSTPSQRTTTCLTLDIGLQNAKYLFSSTRPASLSSLNVHTTATGTLIRYVLDTPSSSKAPMPSMSQDPDRQAPPPSSTTTNPENSDASSP